MALDRAEPWIGGLGNRLCSTEMSWRHRLGERPAQPADEAALLARLADGDGQALALLYRRESGAVYRYALALAGDEAAALDAMQEAFSQLLTQGQGFDPARGSLGAYLAGIARHHLLAQWRRRCEPLPEFDDEAGEHPLAHSPDALLLRQQDEAALWAAVRRLSWSQREALVLVDLQERSYAEAAAVAGVAEDVLRSRLHRARARLAQLLGNDDFSGVRS
ncbi:RNA polymerase sigma-70 factor (ECF subfamily) [Inhella inkyongensis]|uniref:RNA polymerase sigma-70 factor (ECF subfamily) n=1 Tax=Inhella inkyongensis TaxID=392593 RepID=A0A840RYU1_9BURK|nr:sigma-70 family RNA polymerase sigma factor [Inhella inkyongensis]MBB5202713.1 RNA polymerase sigma-70 factor (ECF subfamily) [Inhella inkyongensis]